MTTNNYPNINNDHLSVIQSAIDDLATGLITSDEFLAIVNGADINDFVSRSGLEATVDNVDAVDNDVYKPITANTFKRPEFGSHPSHCCYRHGCKYGDHDCPVVDERATQEYPCEQCQSVKELDYQIAELQEERAWSLKLFGNK